MSNFYYDDPVEETSGTRRNFKNILALILVIAVGGTYLQTTLAANISLNSGLVVNFGQGVTGTTACSGGTSLTITPVSSFVNVSGGGAFYFSSVKVSNIPSSCHGKDFTINAYNNSSNTPLAIFNSTATSAVVYNNAGTFELGNGTTEGATITSGSGTFTLTFTTPVAPAASVFKLTIQSSDHVGVVSGSYSIYNIGDIGPGGGKIFFKDLDGFNCGANHSATGSPTGRKCNYLEVAPANWSGGADPARPWATGTSSSGNAITDVNGIANEVNSLQIRTNFDIGLGYKNSLAIVAQGNGITTAAGAARAYSGGSKNDWYLPSDIEINLLCRWGKGKPVDVRANCDSGSGTFNSQTGATFQFSSATNYSSSSERDSSIGWTLNMSSQSLNRDEQKATSRLVRPIRAFSMEYQVGDLGPGGGRIFYISAAGFNCGADYSATGSPTGGKCNFLEVAPGNWSGGVDPLKPWALPAFDSDISGIDNDDSIFQFRTNFKIGNGYKNTTLILAPGNDATTAAGATRAYRGGTKSDWYLPSDVELNLLCHWGRNAIFTTDEKRDAGGTLDPARTCDGGVGAINSGTGNGAGFQSDVFYWSSSENGDGANATVLGLDPTDYVSPSKQDLHSVRPIRAF